jgi:ComF family protein
MLRAGLALGRRLFQWPSQCEVCRGWDSQRVCTRCVDRFARPTARCQHCALALGAAANDCGDCLRDPPPFSATVCGVDYGFPWNHLIGAFKFQGQVDLATPLAERLHAAVLSAALVPPDVVLPVPLSRERLAARGYNQAWELARRVATAQRLPRRASVLLRTLDTAPQAELGRKERQRNLRAAFVVDPQQRRWLSGRRVALVDDVMTTGATLREATSTLLRAGAVDVQAWVLARTPLPALP